MNYFKKSCCVFKHLSTSEDSSLPTRPCFSQQEQLCKITNLTQSAFSDEIQHLRYEHLWPGSPESSHQGQSSPSDMFLFPRKEILKKRKKRKRERRRRKESKLQRLQVFHITQNTLYKLVNIYFQIFHIQTYTMAYIQSTINARSCCVISFCF